MRKRVFAAVLALALTLSLSPAALALDGFADVTDTATARNVEVLRLMGVVGGDGDGSFRPGSSLTRAEFCKMAVELLGEGSQVVRYRSRTIFPDVRVSHWAAGYINFAASYQLPAENGREATRLIRGQPDGTFEPDRNISFGEAVTILMRMLGYTDEMSGGIWPQGYLDLAEANGLSKGLVRSGDSAITRALAAQLFVNALSVKTVSGGTLKTLGEETTLLAVDISKGVLRTTDGKSAPKETTMVRPASSTVLNGLRGRIVLNADGKALTFLPSASTTGGASGVAVGGAVSNAAVIVASNGSTAGFDALTGGASSYTIYRNGVRITAKELRRYDVATYSAASNAILVCDTRVSVYYENCSPSPSAPIAIEALDGTAFAVLPTAQQSVAQFKPGQIMVLLLTTDGQVAGAVESGTPDAQGNALGYVDASGAVTMFCGGSLLGIKAKDADKAGQVVRIAQNKSGMVLSKQTNVARGAVDVAAGTMGSSKLASGVMVIKEGVLTSLAALGMSRIEQRHVVYSRRNSAGEIDLIVLGNTEAEVIGRVKMWSVWVADSDHVGEAPNEGVNGHFENRMSLDRPEGETAESRFTFSAQTGDFAAVQINSQNNFYRFTKLTKLSGVPAASWLGTSAVNYQAHTYSVASDIMCYNRDNGQWFGSLEAAILYGGTMNIYILDGVVRAVDVGT